jgi:hypothetical protein
MPRRDSAHSRTYVEVCLDAQIRRADYPRSGVKDVASFFTPPKRADHVCPTSNPSEKAAREI